MKKLYVNSNGQVYYLLFGKIGKPSLLLNMNYDQYVVVRMLEKNSWWHGEYFINFDDAYDFYKEKFGGENNEI